MGPITLVVDIRPSVNRTVSLRNHHGLERLQGMNIRTDHWHGHLQFRNSALLPGGRLVFMELAVRIPRELVHPTDLAGHTAGLTLMEQAGIMEQNQYAELTDDFFSCTLYHPYAEVVANLLDLPIVMLAETYRFRPLLVFHNFVVQERKPYAPYIKLFTVSSGARSAVALAAFYRVHPETDEVQTFRLTNSGSFPYIENA